MRRVLESLGFAASTLWDVDRWTAHRIWDAYDQILEANTLTAFRVDQARYADLHLPTRMGVDRQKGCSCGNGWFCC